MATGFPVKANYATGDVLTAANMNDLSGTVNYLQYMPPRNVILNSAMNVWQRGTSFALAASTGGTYIADRWQTYTSANQASTFSRQATGDTTNLPNIQYCLRFQRNSGQTGTTLYNLAMSLETFNSVPLAGKTVTLSFYARAGTNYSATSNALSAVLVTGTGTDQNVISGFTGAAYPISGTATLTTTWQRFSYTGTIASTATQIGLLFQYTPVGTAGANDYFEVTGVQLELGSVANTYMPNQPTYQGELAACQRYYCKSYSTDVAPQTNTSAVGLEMKTASGAVAHTSYLGSVQYPVAMRSAPTVTIYSYTSSTAAKVSDAAGTDLAASSGATNLIGTRGFTAQNSSGGNITPAQGGFVFHWVASAEL